MARWAGCRWRRLPGRSEEVLAAGPGGDVAAHLVAALGDDGLDPVPGQSLHDLRRLENPDHVAGEEGPDDGGLQRGLDPHPDAIGQDLGVAACREVGRRSRAHGLGKLDGHRHLFCAHRLLGRGRAGLRGWPVPAPDRPGQGPGHDIGGIGDVGRRGDRGLERALGGGLEVADLGHRREVDLDRGRGREAGAGEEQDVIGRSGDRVNPNGGGRHAHLARGTRRGGGRRRRGGLTR